MKFLSTNLDICKFNSSVDGTNRRYKLKLHEPSTNFIVYQKGVFYSSIKIYDKLPDIAELVSNRKCFVIRLKKYLIDKAFYSLEKYLNTLYRLLYVGESKIIRTIGTCFAFGYTAGWA